MKFRVNFHRVHRLEVGSAVIEARDQHEALVKAQALARAGGFRTDISPPIAAQQWHASMPVQISEDNG